MNAPTNVPPDSPFDAQPIASADPSSTRPMYWSVRRELWENRSIYIAPLVVAAVVLFASLIGTLGLPRKIRNLPTLDLAKQQAVVERPFQMAPAPIMLATFIVGLFYCLDALYGERRDRSILFWKSLPVSDRTTVLSKASIPLAVLPAIAFALSVIVQAVLLFASNLVLLGSGLSPAPLWTEVRFFELVPIMLYGLTVHALWFAPIYCWLLLISAWAKRSPFLWAVMPLLAVSAVEKITFNTSAFMGLLKYRVMGAMAEAFVFKPSARGNVDRINQLAPWNFLTRPGLWFGLAFAAAFLYAAVRVRRKREPI